MRRKHGIFVCFLNNTIEHHKEEGQDIIFHQKRKLNTVYTLKTEYTPENFIDTCPVPVHNM